MAASSASCVRLPLDPVGDIAPWVFGVTFSSLLYGGLLVMMVSYIKDNPKDHIFNRIVLALLFLLSTLGWGVHVRALYYFSVTARDDDNLLVAVPNVIGVTVGVIPFSNGISQAFFSLRSYRITKNNKIIGGFLIFLILGCFALGLVAMGQGNSKGPEETEFIPRGRGPLNGGDLKSFPSAVEDAFWSSVKWNSIFLAVSAASDLIITLILVIPLSKQWGEIHGFNPSTDTLIKRVLGISLSSAAITSSFSLAVAILSISTLRKNNAAWATIILQPHVCALVVLGTLMLRQRLDKSSSYYKRSNRDHSRSISGPVGLTSTNPAAAVSQFQIGSVEFQSKNLKYDDSWQTTPIPRPTEVLGTQKNDVESGTLYQAYPSRR